MKKQSIPFTQFWADYQASFKAILSLSYPIVIAQIGIVAMGVTDNLMVGQYLGEAALGASGIANSIFFVICIIGIGMMSIVPPLVAGAKIRQDMLLCRNLLRSSVQICILASVLSFFILLFFVYNFHWFAQKPAVDALAVPYLLIVSISILPILIFLGFKSFTDGLSLTRPAMYVSFVCFLLNIPFNWIFIKGAFGIPALGLNGAGIATLLSRVFMGLGMALLVLYSPKIKRYYGSINLRRWDSSSIMKITRLGLPAGLQYLFEVGAFASAAIMIGWLGKNQLAAHQIAISLASITYMIAAGFAAAGSIRVGDAYGNQNLKGVFRNGSTSLLLTSIFMLASCLFFILSKETLVSWYIDSGEVPQMATSLLTIAAFFQLSDGIQCAALGALRGLEDVNIPTLFAFIAYWVISLPLGYYFAFELGMDIEGVWLALLIGLSISAVLLTGRFYWLVEKKRSKLSSSIAKQTAVKAPTI